MTDQEQTPPPNSHTHLPGRVIGIVHSTKPRENGKVYIFLRGPDGTEYFSHISGWQEAEAFKGAAVTQPVSFKVTMTPSGKRAWDVRAPTVDEQALVESFADQEAAARANSVRADELAESAGRTGRHIPVKRQRRTRQEIESED